MAGALAVIASPVVAQDLCERLDALDLSIPISSKLDLRQGSAACRTSLALGGARNIHCVLEFPYRSAAAQVAFDELVAEMTQCLGPETRISTDQSVNHPDAFDLREFDHAGRIYAVSIKDKGALQQTLVFVRVQQG